MEILSCVTTFEDPRDANVQTDFPDSAANISSFGTAILPSEGGELARYEEGGAGHVVPGPDGRVVYTAGGVRSSQLKPVAGTDPEAGYCLPAVEGSTPVGPKSFWEEPHRIHTLHRTGGTLLSSPGRNIDLFSKNNRRAS